MKPLVVIKGWGGGIEMIKELNKKPSKTHFDKLYSGKNYSFKFNYDKTILESILENKQSGKILDLGCGEGGISLALAERGFDVTCVDISRIAIEKIKKEAEKRKIKINAICMDLDKYILEGNYDVILCLGILQFFGKNGEEFLRNVKKHTKRKGINIIDAFVNKCLPKGKLSNIYSNWRILEKEIYDLKTDKINRKMIYLVVIK